MLYHPALPAVLGFIALILIAVPAWAILHSQRDRERGVPGVATIVEKEERPFKGSFHCWVEFGGRRCRVPIQKDDWRALKRGETVNILYDPEKPGHVSYGKIAGAPYAMLIYTSLIAFGLLTATAAWRLWFA